MNNDIKINEKQRSLEIKLKDEHMLLNSPEYRKFTEEYVLALGKKMEEMFKGVSFIISLRYKSDKSFEGKLNRILERDSEENKNIYDNIGIKVVVTHITDKVEHANCQSIIEERNRLINKNIENEALRENKLKLKIRHLQVYLKALLCQFENDIEFVDYIKSRYRDIRDNSENKTKESEGYSSLINVLEAKIKKLDSERKLDEKDEKIRNLEFALCKSNISRTETELNLIDENILLTTLLYNEVDKRGNDLYATYMFERIKNINLNGTKSIPGRCKRHTGSKHYYVASHDSIGVRKDSDHPGWKIELQVTSDYYNQDAIDGKAKHSEIDGKERIAPAFVSSKEEYNAKIKSGVPDTLVYISGEDTLYKCSDLENFYLYYKEVVGSEYMKNLEEVLEGNSEVFGESEEGIDRMI